MRPIGTIRTFKTENFTVIMDALPENDLDLSFDEDGSVAAGLESGKFIAFVARARVLFQGEEITTTDADLSPAAREKRIADKLGIVSPSDVYTPLQLTTQALKDIINAAGNGEPYTPQDLVSLFQNDYGIGAEELHRQGIEEIA